MRPDFLAVLHVDRPLQANPETAPFGELLQLGDLVERNERKDM